MSHPIYDELAAKYRYDTVTGWTFEDGPCGHSPPACYECGCQRPWANAWEALCWAVPPCSIWEPVDFIDTSE